MIQRILITAILLSSCLLSVKLLHPTTTLEGKWRWAFSHHIEGTRFSADSLKRQLIHEYHANGTYTIWENGKRSPGKHTYALRQSTHPNGSGQKVTFIAMNDGKFKEESLVWLQGDAHDTLLLVALDPRHKEYLYSIYTRVKN